MSRNSAISREAKEYIKELIAEFGELTVDEVVDLISPHYCFDPLKSKERELKSQARRIMATIRSADGERIVLAVEGMPGQYINIDLCKNPFLLSRVVKQLDRQYEGLGRTWKRAHRKLNAITEGQISMFSGCEQTSQMESYGNAFSRGDTWN